MKRPVLILGSLDGIEIPYDLEDTDLAEYRRLHPKWHDWSRVKELCATIAVDLFADL